MSRNLTQELKALPGFEPPAQGWARVQARLAQPAPVERVGWQYGGLAAALVLIAAGLFWEGASWHLQSGSAPAIPGHDGEGVTQPAATDPSIDELVERSQQLEALLRGLPSRPAVERAATSATIDELQRSIQLVDLRLIGSDSDRSDQQHLWSTRVALLGSLWTVRYAEAASAGGLSQIDAGVI